MLQKSVPEGDTLELLLEYCQQPFLKDFSLSGGTALALRLGHRKSYDLDFFSSVKFDPYLLEQELESYYGIAFQKQGNLSNALFSNVKSSKSDFIYDYGKISHPREVIDGVRICPVDENIAMKLNAMPGEGRKEIFLIFILYFITIHFPKYLIFFPRNSEKNDLLCF